MIYNKIGTIYGNSLSLPKQELAKINYNLISRYLAYEDIDDEEEDLDPKNIIQKWKRIKIAVEKSNLNQSKNA